MENTEETLSIVEAHRTWCEVHSLGIGRDVCRDLVEGLAVCSGGIFAFIADGDGMLNTKVIDILSRSVEPSYTQVSVSLVNGGSGSNSVMCYPEMGVRKHVRRHHDYVFYAILPIECYDTFQLNFSCFNTLT